MAALEGEEKAATGHPLLRMLRRDKYTHGLYPAQMEALRAMCAALIPSLPPEEEALDGRRDTTPRDKDLERFYLASGADSTIPDEVIDRSSSMYNCVRTLHTLRTRLLPCSSMVFGTPSAKTHRTDMTARQQNNLDYHYRLRDSHLTGPRPSPMHTEIN